MKSNELLKLLKAEAGESPQKIYIPSMKKEMSFKPLTAGMQKTISRVAIEDTSFSMGDYRLTQLSCLKALCLENFEEQKITDIDFLCALASLRVYNKLEPLALTLNCECGQKVSFNLNCEYVIEQLRNYTSEKLTFQKKHFMFELGDPYILDVINFEVLDEMIQKDEKLSQSMDSNKMRIVNYPIQFIKNIFVGPDQEPIDNYSELKFNEKIELLDNFPSGIIYGEGETLVKFILEKFNPDRLNKFFQKIYCPFCKKDNKEGALSTANFFII